MRVTLIIALVFIETFLVNKVEIISIDFEELRGKNENFELSQINFFRDAGNFIHCQLDGCVRRDYPSICFCGHKYQQ